MSDTAQTIVVDNLDHDNTATVTFRGVTVTLTLRDVEYAELTGTNPDTVLVFVDTSQESEIPLSVQINDDTVFEGLIS